MTSYSRKYDRTARILTVVCGLLFSAFSFVYLYVLQVDLLHALHTCLSGGKTVFNAFWSAVIITLVLVLLRWGVNSLLGLKGVLRALSWFPSFLLLGVLTDVGYTVGSEGMNGRWMWLLPLLLLVFFVGGYALRRVYRLWFDVMEPDAWLNAFCSFVILLLFGYMTVSIGNTDIHLHHELAVHQAILDGDYEEARRIGAKVTDPNRALTALRGASLSREGTLGEYLFTCPQPYGADGLMVDDAFTPILPATRDSLYAYWGTKPRTGESGVDFFRRLCTDEVEGQVARDYYLSALLLDKQLERFIQVLGKDEAVSDSLPKHYKEAVFLYGKLHPEQAYASSDAALETQWQAYEALQTELSGTVGEANRMRRKFGETYWWYYFFH